MGLMGLQRQSVNPLQSGVLNKKKVCFLGHPVGDKMETGEESQDEFSKFSLWHLGEM